MLILSIDTSTRAGSVALLRREELLGHLNTPSDEAYSGSLLPAVDLVLGNAGTNIREIDLFAVTAGPGSFTGLRVGLTAVKAWAEAFAKPVAAVSALEAIAEQSLAKATRSGPILLAAVLDARRGQVFGCLYRRAGDSSEALVAVLPEVVVGASEFLELVSQQSEGETALFVSPTPEVIRPALTESSLRGCDVEQVSPVLAPSVGRLGYRKALRGDLVDALQLDANYVRRSDAESRWKE